MWVSEVFEDLWLAKKVRCNLIGNRLVIPHDSIPSNVGSNFEIFKALKKLLKYSFIVLILILMSCEKDSPEIDKVLIIGLSDSNILLRDIDPDTLLTSWEIETDYQLDINDDNKDDINLSVVNKYAFGGLSLVSSKLKIETLNNKTFIKADSIYPLVLSYGDTITIENSWKNGSLLLLQSSEECCPPNGTMIHEGYWKDQSENYVGIQHQGRLGWIKIGVSGYLSIKVYEYAIMK